MLKRLVLVVVALAACATATGLLATSGSSADGERARGGATVRGGAPVRGSSPARGGAPVRGSAYDRGGAPECRGTAAIELRCQLRRYGTLTRTAGVDAAFAELKRAYEREGLVRAACHPIVHEIGHAAVERHGDDLPQLYARGDPFCSAGYFHGVTERIVASMGADRFVARADSLCADLGGPARHSIYHRNCAHGIGHGFMLALDGELPAALETCDGLADRWEQRSCYGGVFMQNVMTLSDSKYLRPRDPLYPCPELADRHRAMCYQKQTGYALYVRDGDAGDVFSLCARVAGGFRAPCHEGLGTSVAVHYLKQVFDDGDRRRLTAAACALGERRAARASCVGGAVRALINYDHDVVQATRLCEVVSARLRASCRGAIRAKRAYPE